jgi:glycogen operon protein
MILHGDEFGRTQGGNNNAYCQDNEISWMNWNLTPEQRQLLEWTRRVTKLRRDHPVLRRRRYFQGRSIRGAGVKDISWFQPDGSEMTDEAWAQDDQLLGVYIAGAAADLLDVRGDPVTDDNMLLLLNGRDEAVTFSFPVYGRRRGGWRVMLDSARPKETTTPVRGGAYTLAPRSIAVLGQQSGR